jgi:hypothetical protein
MYRAVSTNTLTVACNETLGEVRNSSVGIATRYGLDGQGIESCVGGGGGRDFPHSSRPALGPIQPHIKWAPGLSQG